MEGQSGCVQVVVQFIMKPEDIAHNSVNRFVDKAYNKYMAGQEEHGGCLLDKSKSLDFFLDHIEEEIVDLWHYVQAFRIAQADMLVNGKRSDDIKEVERVMDEELSEKLRHVV